MQCSESMQYWLSGDWVAVTVRAALMAVGKHLAAGKCAVRSVLDVEFVRRRMSLEYWRCVVNGKRKDTAHDPGH